MSGIQEAVQQRAPRLPTLLRHVHKPTSSISEAQIPSDIEIEDMSVTQLEVYINKSLSGCIADFWRGTKHRRAAYLASKAASRGSDEFPSNLTQEVSRVLKSDVTEYVAAVERDVRIAPLSHGYLRRYEHYRAALARLTTLYEKPVPMHSSPEKHIQAGIDTSVLFMMSALNTLPFLLHRAGLVRDDMSPERKQEVFMELVPAVRDFVTLLATINIKVIAAMQRSPFIAFYIPLEHRVPFLKHLELRLVNGRYTIDLDEDGEALLRSHLNGILGNSDMRLTCPALKADVIHDELEFVVELFKVACFQHLDRLLAMFGEAKS